MSDKNAITPGSSIKNNENFTAKIKTPKVKLINSKQKSKNDDLDMFKEILNYKPGDASAKTTLSKKQ